MRLFCFKPIEHILALAHTNTVYTFNTWPKASLIYHYPSYTIYILGFSGKRTRRDGNDTVHIIIEHRNRSKGCLVLYNNR